MLIGRYIFRQTASALVMILISLTLIVWLTSILREIKLLTSQGQTFWIFIKITSLAIPSLLVTVAPVAFLIAALHTLNRMNGDSEIIVLSAAGSSVWRILTPYLGLGFIVSICVLLANVYLLPASARLLTTFVSQVRSDVLSQILQPGEFSELEKGLTFHIRDKAQNGDLLGVVVRDERDQKTVTTVIADRGEILSDGSRSVMQLHDGQILRRPENKNETQIVVFQSYLFDMSDFEPKTGAREPKPRERGIYELLYPDKTSAFYRQNRAKLRSELHERLSTPLYPILFAFIAVLYLGRPRTTREGRAMLLAGAFLAGATIRIAGIAGVNIAGKQQWALVIIYGLPILGILLSIIMLRFNILPPALTLPSIPLPRFLDIRQWGTAKTLSKPS